MGETEIDELKRAFQEANSGNWIPVVLLVFIFGIIILLLLYIWKESDKRNGERHKKHEETQEKLVEITIQQKDTITELKTMVWYHEEELKGQRNKRSA